MPDTNHADTGATAISWERVACPLCGSSRETELLAAPEDPAAEVYRLVRCGDCGMGYLNPRPDRQSIGQYYPADYEPYQADGRRRDGVWDRLRGYLSSLVLSHSYAYPPPLERWYQKMLATLAGPWFGPNRNSLTALPFHGEGRLLDFGCGSGWFARRMRERGWRVTGMDFSSDAARQARRNYGIDVLVGSLPHADVAPASFDVITMGAVLEHLHEPQRVVAAAREALRPGGRLVVTVQNLKSWSFRFFGADWWGLDLPRHLLHFTPETLRKLAEQNGLIVRKLTTPVRAGWVRRSLKDARRRGSASSRLLTARLARLRIITSLIARWTGWTGQADSICMIAERPIAARQTPAKGQSSRRAA